MSSWTSRLPKYYFQHNVIMNKVVSIEWMWPLGWIISFSWQWLCNTILNNDDDAAKILYSTTLILNYYKYVSAYTRIMLKILFKEIGHNPLYEQRSLSSLFHTENLILQIRKIHHRNHVSFFYPLDGLTTISRSTHFL